MPRLEFDNLGSANLVQNSLPPESVQSIQFPNHTDAFHSRFAIHWNQSFTVQKKLSMTDKILNSIYQKMVPIIINNSRYYMPYSDAAILEIALRGNTLTDRLDYQEAGRLLTDRFGRDFASASYNNTEFDPFGLTFDIPRIETQMPAQLQPTIDLGRSRAINE